MPYATLQTLIDRFGEATLVQLTDRNGTGVIDPAALERAIADADAVIDGYLANRYRLPLSETPPMLVPVAGDLAFYQLHPHGAPEEVRNRYRAAIRLLEGVASGSVRLGIDGAEPSSAPGEARVDGPARVFSRDRLKGY